MVSLSFSILTFTASVELLLDIFTHSPAKEMDVDPLFLQTESLSVVLASTQDVHAYTRFAFKFLEIFNKRSNYASTLQITPQLLKAGDYCI